MGVIGSPWKLYVEPNTKEIFYHNFETDEQLTWGNITEKGESHCGGVEEKSGHGWT